MDVELKSLVIPRETGLDPPLLTIANKEWLDMIRKSSDQLCASFARIHYKKLLTLLTRTNGVMEVQSLLRTATPPVNSRLRSRLVKSVSIFQYLYLSQCFHSLVTRLQCGVTLTSTARALYSLTPNGKQSLLAGRKRVNKPRNWLQTSQP